MSRFTASFFATTIVFLLLATPVWTQPALQLQSFPVIVNNNANLRAGPGTAYERTGLVSAGATIQIDGCDSGCEWYRLTSGYWIAGFLVDGTPENLPEVIIEASTASAQSSPVPPGAIAADNANLRSGPGTTFDKVGSVSTGVTLNIIARNAEGDWYQITDKTWIAAFLVTDAPENLPVASSEAAATSGSSIAAAPIEQTAIDDANLRSGPGTSYTRTGGVSSGAILEIVARNSKGDWYQLENGTWIAAMLVTNAPESLPVATDAASTSQPTPAASARPAFFIVDAPSLLGRPVHAMEAVLGNAVNILKMKPGYLESIPGGGEARDYSYNGTSLSVDFDKAGIARGVSMGASFAPGTLLELYEIKLNQWSKLLNAMGLPVDREPIRNAPYSLIWYNLSGLRVEMVAYKDEVIWLILIRSAN